MQFVLTGIRQRNLFAEKDWYQFKINFRACTMTLILQGVRDAEPKFQRTEKISQTKCKKFRIQSEDHLKESTPLSPQYREKTEIGFVMQWKSHFYDNIDLFEYFKCVMCEMMAKSNNHEPK